MKKETELSPEELAIWYEDWNDENLAFIKYDNYEGDKMWVIYGADGSRIAVTDNRDFAFWVARQRDLEPCSVH
ncbi:MAG: DUF1150 family protein [Alphaproteobacteria bacterium]|nr:DUF1150 family protein [Alphaproteobacteria bacterium]